MNAILQELFESLSIRGGIEIVESDVKPTKLRLIGRLRPNAGDHWKMVMHRLLLSEVDAPWKIDISKKYFLRGNQVFYGWRIILNGEDLETQYPNIIQLIKTALKPNPISTGVDEVPLIGVSPNRATRTNVGFTDRVAVGPLAIRNQ